VRLILDVPRLPLTAVPKEAVRPRRLRITVRPVVHALLADVTRPE
jgi:hypothetical protein